MDINHKIVNNYTLLFYDEKVKEVKEDRKIKREKVLIILKETKENILEFINKLLKS